MLEKRDEEETKRRSTIKNIKTRKTGKRRWRRRMKRKPKEEWTR